MTIIRDDKFIVKVGKNIRKMRLSKGMSQYQLADLANINRSQIIDIETGKINTTISTLKTIADALEVEPKDLL